MNPHTAPNSLPEMSAQEASWHTHISGMRAADLARTAGADPAATAAIASATAGPVNVAGYAIAKATQGTIWTLQRIAREFAQWATSRGLPISPDPNEPGTRELIELGLATLVFCNSRSCWTTLDAGGLADLISQAQDMMWEMPLATQLALQDHFRIEMNRIRDLSGADDDEPKKKPLPMASALPVIPIPPPAPASPLSSGSPANTGSPSKQPSGPLPWPSPSSFFPSATND